MTAPPVRLGVVGVGRWGANIIRTIAAEPTLRLTGVARRDAAAQASVPADCRIFSDWQSLVASSDIDGVMIATPPATHADMLAAAIERGKAAFVEKPLVVRASDVQRLRALRQTSRAAVLVDHTHLFHPAFIALQREAATLGPIRSITSSAGSRGPYRMDVSVLWDWAPHDIAMCLALRPGHCAAVSGKRTASRPMGNATAETIELELKLAGDIPARIRLSTLDDRHRWFAVRFDACTLVFRDYPAELVRLPPDADPFSGGIPLPFTDEPPLTRAILEFAEAIRTNSRDTASLERGFAVVDVILAIEQILT